MEHRKTAPYLEECSFITCPKESEASRKCKKLYEARTRVEYGSLSLFQSAHEEQNTTEQNSELGCKIQTTNRKYTHSRKDNYQHHIAILCQPNRQK